MGVPTAEIRAMILARHAAGEPVVLREVVDTYGISLRTAHKIRNALVEEGLISPESTNPKRAGRRRMALERDADPGDWASFVESVVNGTATTISEDQQRAVLSAMIMSHPSAALRVAAQNALTRLNASSASSGTVGPGIPLTDEARIDRLSRLMESQGLVIVRAALKKAFPRGAERYLDGDLGIAQENTSPTT